MKKLLLLVISSLAILTVAPAAHAYDNDKWHDADKTLHQLYLRMDAVKAERDRLGASPKVQDQLERLRSGMADLSLSLRYHKGDPDIAAKQADNLAGLMSRVEEEYQHHKHHDGEVIRVYPGQ